MAQVRNRIAEVIPWLIFLIACGVGGIKIDQLNQRDDEQLRKLEVLSTALEEIKVAATNEEWTPSQKTHSIEQVLAMTEEECKKVKVE